MSDADVDGSHIRTLLLSFFYRQMPELIEGGHIFIAQPPLFRVRDRNRNSYLQTDAELKNILLQRGLPKCQMTARDGRVFGPEDLTRIIDWFTTNADNSAALSIEGLSELDLGLDSNLDSNVPRFIVEGSGKLLELDSLNAVANAVRTIGETGIQVTRFKGLGEMNAKELRETTLLPEKRRLLRVTMEDAAAASEMFQLLMGVSVEPRRRFIEDNALNARSLDI